MKRFLKYTLITLSSILLLLAILLTSVWLQSVAPEQRKPDIEMYSFADTLANREYDLDSLKAIIGDNKGLPEGFEIAAAIAYSAFPQLRDVNIDMVLTNHGVPMESNFNIPTLFGPKKYRQYRILLNDNKNSNNPILLRALPFDAQVGILAHELGHVAYYYELNLFQIGKWGLSYLINDGYSAIHERTTDLMPVYHGLGSQIYQYAYYVRYDPSCQLFYERNKGWMDKYYMTDEELLAFIHRQVE